MFSRSVVLSEEAKNDIEHVLAYTQRVWGADQRGRYRRQIDAALERLTHFPELGEQVDGFAVDIRRIPVGQHSIYYRDTGEAINIVRVLHEKMDATSHIDSRD